MYTEADRARVGPNAILQTDTVLRDRVGEGGRRSLFESAGLQDYIETPPDAMIPQSDAASLFCAVSRNLPPELSGSVLREAGQRTARYIAENRIPKGARQLLNVLPAPLAGRLLLHAITKNAWTFAGTGRVTAGYGRPLRLTIEDNPLATPGCVWHLAVIETLYGVVTAREYRVRQRTCCAEGDRACVFEISSTAHRSPQAPGSSRVGLR